MNILPLDCIYTILSYVRDQETLRGTYLTCKTFMRFYINTPSGIFIYKKYINKLMETLYDYPDLKWDYGSLSSNKLLKYYYVKEHPDKSWDYDSLSNNSAIKPSDILGDIDKPWDWFDLTSKMPVDFIMKYPDTPDVPKGTVGGWNWAYLNDKIPLDFIMNNKHRNWDWRKIFYKHNIKVKKFIVDNPDLNYDWRDLTYKYYTKLDFIAEHLELGWKLDSYAISKNMPLEIILNNPDLSWHWHDISMRNVPLEFILENIDKDYSWKHIIDKPFMTIELIKHIQSMGINIDKHIRNFSKNTSITFDIVMDNPDFPWNWTYLSGNHSITEDDIINNPNPIIGEWDFDTIEYRNDLTIKIVKAFPDINWSPYTLSRSSKLEMHHILDNMDRYWEWNCISQNKNITIEDIVAHPELPWNWKTISKREKLFQ